MAYPAPSALLQLLKPITWFPPMWAFACGVVSSGVSPQQRWPLVIVGIILAGPLVCATSQAVNDWFDRHVDAINEPNRPIPSGRIPGRWGLYVAIVWTLLSLAVATQLGTWGFIAASAGLILAWLYSAPPVRLKKNGWWGNGAVGFSYESLPWITGAAVMAAGALPDWRILVVALLYGVGAHGIMTLNDFKSMAGDRRMGVSSLPVQLGAERAAKVACAVMVAPQLLVLVLLVEWDRPLHAIGIAFLLACQLLLMMHFLRSPSERARWYSALGINFYVSGMLVCAFALRPVAGVAS